MAPRYSSTIKCRTPLIQRIRQSTTRRLDPVTRAPVLLDSEVSVNFHIRETEGGFSDIYRGTWTLPAEDGGECLQVGVKVLRPIKLGHQVVGPSRMRKRLNREVEVWRILEHPNISEFYGILFQIDERPALVMRWYDNGAATNYIQTQSDANKLGIVLNIAEGLEYLHSLNPPIIHGDLKGNNVLITQTGSAVISDFGLSKLKQDLGIHTGNTTSSVSGNARWQSPEYFPDEDDSECIRALTIIAEPSDVWAYACTVYELLTGNVPYSRIRRSHSEYKVVKAITSGQKPAIDLDKIEGETAGLPQLLEDCWSFGPEGRPKIQQVVSRLRGMLSVRVAA